MQTKFPQSSFFSNTWLKDLAFLTLVIGLLFGIMLGSFQLESPDGARYAEIPREMVVSGDYITPHINGVKYFEKPPLFYWMQVGTIKVFGLSEWAVHANNALLSLLTCLFVYVVGRKLYNRRTGIIASSVLATSVLFYVLGRIITLDTALTAFLTAALFCFFLGTREILKLAKDSSAVSKKNLSEIFALPSNLYMWLFYVFIALAVLTKGLIGLLLPGMIIFAWTALYNEWKYLKTYSIFSGSILFLLITVPWHVLVQMKNPEFFHFYFVEQHFLRYLTPYAGREQPFWFFPAIFVVGFFPWICFLPGALKRFFAQKWIVIKQDQAAVFSLLWAAIVFLFFNISDSKLATYILPMFPPLALFMGRYLSMCFSSSKFAYLETENFTSPPTQNKSFQKSFQYRVITPLMAIIKTLYCQINFRWLKSWVGGKQGSCVSSSTLPKQQSIATALKVFCFITVLFGFVALIAINFIDFKNCAINPLNFYLVGSTLVIGGLLTYFFYQKYGTKLSLIVLILVQAGFLLSLAPNINIGNGKSIKTLITVLQQNLKSGDQVASFATYYQDLPYYLRKSVLVVDFKGELDFGTRYADTSNWMIDRNTFWRHWHSNKRMFVIFEKNNYDDFKAHAGKQLVFLGQYMNTMLFSNHYSN